MNKLYYSLFLFLFFIAANAQIINIPDANFKARLLAASPSNYTASTQTPTSEGNISSYNTIDTNGDGEIQVSEASLIKYLDIYNSSIFNIEGISDFSNLETFNCSTNQLKSLNVKGLTNLQRLYCSSNLLTVLDVSGLTNLQSFWCAENQLTSLNVAGLTNLKTFYCRQNQLKSLDMTGLTNLVQFHCNDNQLTSIDVSNFKYLQGLYCYTNKLTSLKVSGLTNLQTLSCSDNLLKSLDVLKLNNLQTLLCSQNQLKILNVSELTNLQSLSCYENLLTNLDVLGLTNLQSLVCENNQLTSLDLSESTNLRTLYCNKNKLSSLFLKNGSFSWETLLFKDNPDLVYICADEAEISLIQNKINEYGYATTCYVNSYCSFNPGGVFYTINGESKLNDNNSDCKESTLFFPNLKFLITDGTISGNFISNASGNYSFTMSEGTHTINPQLENPSYFNVSPASATVTFPTTASPFIQDFCITPNSVYHDLETVIIPLIPARPGFDATYKVKYKNKGNTIETATLVLDYVDASSDYVLSTIAPTSQSKGKLFWNLGTITPFESGEMVITMNVNSPMETPAVNGGDILSLIASINGLNTDETLLDNTFALRQVVVNSFDPNDKTCLEGNTINPRMIGEYIHYKIRFENTGTYAAQNIVVKDVIDTTKFDVSTLQMTDASHSCVTRITDPDKVEFIFENINLPFDDANNDGYVVFKIKTKPTLSVGDIISNFANIYFDYNFPIVTNTETSTFQTLANKEFNLDNYVSLSPNPAKDILNIAIQDNENVKSIGIYNMLGQLVQITTSPRNLINVSHLNTGNYIIKLNTDKGEISKKFIKE